MESLTHMTMTITLGELLEGIRKNPDLSEVKHFGHEPLGIPVELGKALGLASKSQNIVETKNVEVMDTTTHEPELDWFELTEVIDDLGEGKVPTYSLDWCEEIAPMGAFDVKFKGLAVATIECSDFDSEEKYLRALQLLTKAKAKPTDQIGRLDYSGCGPGIQLLCSDTKKEFAENEDVTRLLAYIGGARRSAVRDLIARMDEFGTNKSYTLLWDGVKSNALLAYKGRPIMSLRLDSCPEIKKLILGFIVKWPGPFLVPGRVRLKELSRMQIPKLGVSNGNLSQKKRGSFSSRSSDRSSIYALPGGNVYNLLDLYDPDGNANSSERAKAVAHWASSNERNPKPVKVRNKGGLDYPRPLL